MTDVSVSLPAKRKRGRPRKDGNNYLSREGSFKSPSQLKTQRIQLTSPIKKLQQINPTNGSSVVDGMVGSMIYGVIEGSFDAGYLISVRIGNNGTPFRGVVFQPGKFVPITAANDVAPQARMFQRRDIPVPANYDDPNQVMGGFSPQPRQVILQPVQKQAVFRSVLSPNPQYNNNPTFIRSSSYPNMAGNNTIPRSLGLGANQNSPPVHPTGSLRMVEQDEVMQAFEVSSSSPPPKASDNNNTANPGNAMESNMATHDKQNALNPQLHHNFMEDMTQSAFRVQQDEMICHDFHQDFFSGQSQHNNSVPKSPNLNLDLASTKPTESSCLETNYMVMSQLKNPNHGFHQALVAGNPLLLPPDIMGEPLEESGIVGSGERFHGDGMNNAEGANSNYKLELATPQSTLNRMPTDMDFVLSDVVHPAESQGHQNVISDNQHR